MSRRSHKAHAGAQPHYVTKLSQLRALMAGGLWRDAVLLAARFDRLGPARDAVLSAREAYLRPGFQRQLGRDPDALVAAGVRALQEHYGKA